MRENNCPNHVSALQNRSKNRFRIFGFEQNTYGIRTRFSCLGHRTIQPAPESVSLLNKFLYVSYTHINIWRTGGNERLTRKTPRSPNVANETSPLRSQLWNDLLRALREDTNLEKMYKILTESASLETNKGIPFSPAQLELKLIRNQF